MKVISLPGSSPSFLPLAVHFFRTKTNKGGVVGEVETTKF